VTLYDNSNSLGAITLSLNTKTGVYQGTSSLESTATLKAGTHILNFSYSSPSGNFSQCSASLNITISKRPCTTAPKLSTAMTDTSCPLPFPSGNTCSLGCITGYAPSVPLKSTCTEGSFSAVSGVCKACSSTLVGAVKAISTTTYTTAYKDHIGFGFQFQAPTYNLAYSVNYSNIQVTLNYSCGTATATAKSLALYKAPFQSFVYNVPALASSTANRWNPPTLDGVASDGDIWQFSLAIPSTLCGTTATTTKIYIKSATFSASLVSTVALALQTEFHYWIPHTSTTTQGNVSPTTFCAVKSTSAKYKATCQKTSWTTASSNVLKACKNS